MLIYDDTALHRDRLIEGGASLAPAQHHSLKAQKQIQMHAITLCIKVGISNKSAFVCGKIACHLESQICLLPTLFQNTFQINKKLSVKN